jgi:AcrR family transcriptional regulator
VPVEVEADVGDHDASIVEDVDAHDAAAKGFADPRPGSGDGGSRARRPTGDAVVQAALRLARREGIDALSMRRVADELGTAPISLSRHVADRQALLLAMLDDIVSSLDLPAVHRDPVSELSSVLRAIPPGAPRWQTRFAGHPGRAVGCSRNDRREQGAATATHRHWTLAGCRPAIALRAC